MLISWSDPERPVAAMQCPPPSYAVTGSVRQGPSSNPFCTTSLARSFAGGSELANVSKARQLQDQAKASGAPLQGLEPIGAQRRTASCRRPPARTTGCCRHRRRWRRGRRRPAGRGAEMAARCRGSPRSCRRQPERAAQAALSQRTERLRLGTRQRKVQVRTEHELRRVSHETERRAMQAPSSTQHRRVQGLAR